MELRTLTDPSEWPHICTTPIRYSDTDRQGHVNNAIFATYLEVGRVALLYDAGSTILSPDCDFVLARLSIDFRAELSWPGEVLIGTGVARIGTSSIQLVQGIYQSGRMAATAETVSVMTSNETRRPHPLADNAVGTLKTLIIDASRPR